MPHHYPENHYYIILLQIRTDVKKKWEHANRLQKKNSKHQKSNSASTEQLQKVNFMKAKLN